jgi:1,4-alpha-glucan branching enzyme
MRKIYYLLIIFTLTATACRKANPGTEVQTPVTVPVSQVGLITTSNPFPTADETFILTFDASKGNAAFSGKGGDIYIYTGVITDKSTGPTDWKYVKSPSFNAADPAAKLTAAGANKYQISINPRSFYGVPALEKILKIVMLFRNADGSTKAANADGSDIFLPIYEAGKLSVAFSSPELQPTYVPAPVITITTVGDELQVSGLSSKSAKLSLTLNGTEFATASNATFISGKVKITAIGNQEVKIIANDGSTTAESAFNFVLSGAAEVAALPAAAKEGVVFINNGTSAIVTLYAPEKQSIYVVGDFNNWQVSANQFMKKTPDGKTWWVQIDNLDAQKAYGYQFVIDGKIKVADPYAEKQLDPDNDPSIPAANNPSVPAYPSGKTVGIVSIMQANQPSYAFKNSSFQRPEKNKLVVYELHLRDFLKNNNYSTLTDTLTYLTRLGVNAIELMPVTEFEGNSSWGYNVSFYFAPDKYYGTKVALQRFIDECHSRGIAVIMDMVLNHSFGQSPMVQMYYDQAAGKPTANSPWFNQDPKHPFNVGFDFNHESPATKSFVKNVLKFWMQQYKIDGYRFDLSKGFTQTNSGTTDAGVTAWGNYDASRIAIWKDYNNYIKSIDANNFYVILEHFAADNEEKELSDNGMMLWNNVNGSMNEATMGYVGTSDFSRAFFGTHGFTTGENLITYMQSHDEERTMYKNLAFGNSAGSYNIKTLASALKREEQAAAFLFAVPGPKMIWQFQELGYDVAINENGRTGEKPLHWEYFQQPQRRALFNAYAKFISLKKNNTVFNTTNMSFGVKTAIKYIRLTDATNTVFVIGNFDVVAHNADVDLGSAGNWYEVGKDAPSTFGSSTYAVELQPGEYRILSKNPLKY